MDHSADNFVNILLTAITLNKMPASFSRTQAIRVMGESNGNTNNYNGFWFDNLLSSKHILVDPKSRTNSRRYNVSPLEPATEPAPVAQEAQVVEAPEPPAVPAQLDPLVELARLVWAKMKEHDLIALTINEQGVMSYEQRQVVEVKFRLD